MKLEFRKEIQLFISMTVLLLVSNVACGQYFNKEIKAKIYVERNSEFYTFQATAENVTPSDYNLSYEYAIFNTDENGEVTKSNRVERFFLRANEKVILTQLTVNYSLERKATVLLVLYDADGKVLGRDRIVLEEGGKTEIEASGLLDLQAPSEDQAKPQDGFVLGGFIFKKLITQAGRNFHRFFANDFYNRKISTTKNIKIEEVPGRGRNTRVSIEVDGQLVWQFFAQPRKEFLKEQADIAMARVVRRLQQLEQQKEQLTRY